MTARADTTAVVAAIADGKFLGRTILDRNAAQDARLSGSRIVPVFSAELEDATIVGSASAYALIADVRHRVSVQQGSDVALDLFGHPTQGVRQNGKSYRVPSSTEKMMAQSLGRGGVVVTTTLGYVTLCTHGWVAV